MGELRYKPYGETRSEWGVTPTGRRFTGQLEDSYIKLYQMGARWYDSDLGRWISPDSIVPQAGNPQDLNRYSYTRNNPLKYTDPSGHRPCNDTDENGRCIPEPPILPPPPPIPPSPLGGDPATPWKVGVEWLTGLGERHHEFRDGDPFTELLQTHKHIEEVRAKIVSRVRSRDYRRGRADYNLSGLQGVPKYFQDYSNLLTLGHTGNLAVTYLGTYGLEYFIVSVDRDAGTAEVLFHVWNESTFASATRPPVVGYTPFWNNHVAPLVNNLTSSGPMSRVTQSFWWQETIHFK